MLVKNTAVVQMMIFAIPRFPIDVVLGGEFSRKWEYRGRASSPGSSSHVFSSNCDLQLQYDGSNIKVTKYSRLQQTSESVWGKGIQRMQKSWT